MVAMKGPYRTIFPESYVPPQQVEGSRVAGRTSRAVLVLLDPDRPIRGQGVRQHHGGGDLLGGVGDALAEEVGGWTPGHKDSKMHAIFRTARERQAENRVEVDATRSSPKKNW